MTSFNLTTSGLGSYILSDGESGAIAAGVDLTPDPLTSNIFGNPVILGNGYSAPIWLNVQGSIHSIGDAVYLVPQWVLDGPPVYRIASIAIAAGALISQDSSSTGVDAAGIAGVAANGLFLNNAGSVIGDSAIKIGVSISGDFTWGLNGLPYHWDTVGFSMLNTGMVTGTSGAGVDISGAGEAKLTNSGVISGHGYGGAYHSDTYNAVIDHIINTGTMTVVGASQVAIYTGFGNDRLTNSGTVNGNVGMGGGADVVLNTGIINNILYLGAGNDSYTGTAAGKVNGFVYGGAGTDSLSGANNSAGDLFSGGDGNDSLKGNGGGDKLLGDNGTDLLFGAAGVDSLFGGNGSDYLYGGSGVDALKGGAGDDRFCFQVLSHSGDSISDFANISGNNDDFRINASGFGGGLTIGALAASKFQSRADNHAQDANDRFIFRTTDKTLWFDSNGNAAGGLTMVADLQAGAVVTAGDIILV